MFKYKISIYMKSGNVIYLRERGFQWSHLFYFFIDFSKEEILTKYICEGRHIDIKEIEALIIKEWWQRWG